MKCQIPQISWHGRDPILSVDFQFVSGEIRRLATGGTDAHVVIWYLTLSVSNNAISVECACDITRHNKSVNVVRFSPNGEYLASGDDEGSIIVWKMREAIQNEVSLEEEDDKETWYPFKVLRGHLDDISDLSWSQDNQFLLSGSIDNTIFIWDVLKGQSSRVTKDATSFVQGVAWDPLNEYLVSLSCDRMLRIYSVKTKKLLQKVLKGPVSESADKNSTKAAKLFHDDTLHSFCRRLNFSPNGELLFVPSGVREKEDAVVHTTYVFSRYNMSQPALSLPTGLKYTIAVRCCPVLYKLRSVSEETAVKTMVDLPYRILIAVASQDSLFLYDTQQLMPFAYVSNIHYTHLTDLSWSSDGRIIIVSSTDGYCSFVIFNEGELGEVYEKELDPVVVEKLETVVECNGKLTEIVSEENAMKENVYVNISPSKRKSPNPLKLEKRTPTSANKVGAQTSKLRSIKSFFSPPNQKSAKGNNSNMEEKEKSIVEDPEIEVLEIKFAKREVETEDVSMRDGELAKNEFKKIAADESKSQINENEVKVVEVSKYEIEEVIDNCVNDVQKTIDLENENKEKTDGKPKKRIQLITLQTKNPIQPKEQPKRRIQLTTLSQKHT